MHGITREYGTLAKALVLGSMLIAAPAMAQQRHPAPGEAWREAYQSSPVELTSDAQFQAFAERLKIPPQMAERFRPKRVEGTLRYRLIVSTGGTKLRLRVSNEGGSAPLALSSVSVALAGDGFDAAGTVRRVTFGGKDAITLPAGSPVLSDPVSLPVKAGASLLVSVHGPEALPLAANGPSALVVAPGDQAMAAHMDSATPMTGRPIISAIAVLAPGTRIVATLGDSITDGNRPDPAALHSWPEQLARRLAARKGGNGFAVVNAGISGNRLLAPGVIAEMGDAGLARLDRDVLRIDGLSHLIVLEGTNDIGTAGKGPFGENPVVSADDLIAGYRQLIARAHQRGVKVLLGTITPFGGSMTHSSPDKERTREAVNTWIRTAGEADGVVDFDAALRDPASPAKLQARFDSGDHLHPNEAGSKAMGDAITLSLIQ